MSDEAGRYTAEHIVMDKDVEIRELKHLLEIKDDKIKKLEEKIKTLQPKDSHYVDDVDYAAADESEDNFTEQLSFSFNQK